MSLAIDKSPSNRTGLHYFPLSWWIPASTFIILTPVNKNRIPGAWAWGLNQGKILIVGKNVLIFVYLFFIFEGLCASRNGFLRTQRQNPVCMFCSKPFLCVYRKRTRSLIFFYPWNVKNYRGHINNKGQGWVIQGDTLTLPM